MGVGGRMDFQNKKSFCRRELVMRTKEMFHPTGTFFSPATALHHSKVLDDMKQGKKE